MIKLRGDMSFSILLLVFVLLIVGASLPVEPKARLAPLVVGSATLVFVLLVLRKDIRPPHRRRAGAESGPRPEARKPGAGEGTSFSGKRLVFVLSWLLGFYLVLVFLGFPLSIGIMTLVYLKFEGKAGWARSLLAAGILGAAVFLIFERALGVGLFRGLIFGTILPPI